MPQPNESDMETQVAVDDGRGKWDHRFRPLVGTDNVTTGLWIAPTLDDDGEFRLSFVDLRAICRRLGINRVDVWGHDGE